MQVRQPALRILQIPLSTHALENPLALRDRARRQRDIPKNIVILRELMGERPANAPAPICKTAIPSPPERTPVTWTILARRSLEQFRARIQMNLAVN